MGRSREKEKLSAFLVKLYEKQMMGIDVSKEVKYVIEQCQTKET